MRDRTFDDIVLADLRQMHRNVRDQMHRNVRDQVFLLGFAHETVEVTGLNEVIILGVMLRRVIPGRSTHLYRRPELLAGLDRATKAVWLIIFFASAVSVESHVAVGVVVIYRSRVGTVDRQLAVVDAQPVAMHIGIREQPAL